MPETFVPSLGNEICFWFQVHPAYFLLQKNNKDFLNPIFFELTYKLKDVGVPTMSPGQSLPDINNYPVLNEQAAKQDLGVRNVGALVVVKRRESFLRNACSRTNNWRCDKWQGRVSSRFVLKRDFVFLCSQLMLECGTAFYQDVVRAVADMRTCHFRSVGVNRKKAQRKKSDGQISPLSGALREELWCRQWVPVESRRLRQHSPWSVSFVNSTHFRSKRSEHLRIMWIQRSGDNVPHPKISVWWFKKQLTGGRARWAGPIWHVNTNAMLQGRDGRAAAACRCAGGGAPVDPRQEPGRGRARGDARGAAAQGAAAHQHWGEARRTEGNFVQCSSFVHCTSRVYFNGLAAVALSPAHD